MQPKDPQAAGRRGRLDRPPRSASPARPRARQATRDEKAHGPAPQHPVEIAVQHEAQRLYEHRCVDRRRDVSTLEQRQAGLGTVPRRSGIDDGASPERRLSAEDHPIAARRHHRRRQAQLREAIADAHDASRRREPSRDAPAGVRRPRWARSPRAPRRVDRRSGKRPARRAPLPSSPHRARLPEGSRRRAAPALPARRRGHGLARFAPAHRGPTARAGAERRRQSSPTTASLWRRCRTRGARTSGRRRDASAGPREHARRCRRDGRELRGAGRDPRPSLR